MEQDATKSPSKRPAGGAAGTPSPPPTESGRYIPTYFYGKGRRLFHASVIFSDEAGTFVHLLQTLPVPAVNLLASSTYGGRDGHAVAHLFGELRTDLTSDHFAAVLRAAPGVVDVQIEEGIDGLLIDCSFPLRLASGQEAMVVDREGVALMVDEIRERLGSGGAVLLYNQGMSLGRHDWGGLIRTVGRDFALKNRSYLARWVAGRGIGRGELLESDLDRGTALVRITDNFECNHRTSAAPHSHLVRGLVAGFLSSLWNSEVSCRETRCAAMGEPACEFQVDRVAAEKVDTMEPA